MKQNVILKIQVAESRRTIGVFRWEYRLPQSV
jgi:hypothetical protein